MVEHYTNESLDAKITAQHNELQKAKETFKGHKDICDRLLKLQEKYDHLEKETMGTYESLCSYTKRFQNFRKSAQQNSVYIISNLVCLGLVGQELGVCTKSPASEEPKFIQWSKEKPINLPIFIDNKSVSKAVVEEARRIFKENNIEEDEWQLTTDDILNIYEKVSAEYGIHITSLEDSLSALEDKDILYNKTSDVLKDMNDLFLPDYLEVVKAFRASVDKAIDNIALKAEDLVAHKNLAEDVEKIDDNLRYDDRYGYYGYDKSREEYIKRSHEYIKGLKVINKACADENRLSSQLKKAEEALETFEKERNKFIRERDLKSEIAKLKKFADDVDKQWEKFIEKTNAFANEISHYIVRDSTKDLKLYQLLFYDKQSLEEESPLDADKIMQMRDDYINDLKRKLIGEDTAEVRKELERICEEYYNKKDIDKDIKIELKKVDKRYKQTKEVTQQQFKDISTHLEYFIGSRKRIIEVAKLMANNKHLYNYLSECKKSSIISNYLSGPKNEWMSHVLDNFLVTEDENMKRDSGYDDKNMKGDSGYDIYKGVMRECQYLKSVARTDAGFGNKDAGEPTANIIPNFDYDIIPLKHLGRLNIDDRTIKNAVTDNIVCAPKTAKINRANTIPSNKIVQSLPFPPVLNTTNVQGVEIEMTESHDTNPNIISSRG